MYQIRTELIEFVIQSDELTHQFVLHLAVHQFILPSYPLIVTVSQHVGNSLSMVSYKWLIDSCSKLFEGARDRYQPNVGVVGHVAAIRLGEALGAVGSQGHVGDIRILLLEPVNHRCSNRIRSGKADDNEIRSRNHSSIQSKGFIVAQHGCDVVTAGFKHSSAGYELSLIVRNLYNVSHCLALLLSAAPYAATQVPSATSVIAYT